MPKPLAMSILSYWPSRLPGPWPTVVAELEDLRLEEDSAAVAEEDVSDRAGVEGVTPVGKVVVSGEPPAWVRNAPVAAAIPTLAAATTTTPATASAAISPPRFFSGATVTGSGTGAEAIRCTSA